MTVDVRGVVCPSCGHYTHALDDGDEVVCGGEYTPVGEEAGCGRNLRVSVDVVDDTADEASVEVVWDCVQALSDSEGPFCSGAEVMSFESWMQSAGLRVGGRQ